MLLFAFFLSSNQFLVNEFENGGSTSNMKLDLIQSIFVVSSEQLVSAKYLLIDLFFFFFFFEDWRKLQRRPTSCLAPSSIKKSKFDL